MFLMVTTGIFYALEFKNINSNYAQNVSSILIREDDESFDEIVGDFIWEYRGIEMIIIAFILLSTSAGISILIKKSNSKGRQK